MNKLSTEKRSRVVSCLVEGCSVRSTTRMTGVHRTTILNLLLDLGANGFSKKLQNHEAAVALHFMHYNFARIHQTLLN